MNKLSEEEYIDARLMLADILEAVLKDEAGPNERKKSGGPPASSLLRQSLLNPPKRTKKLPTLCIAVALQKAYIRDYDIQRSGVMVRYSVLRAIRSDGVESYVQRGVKILNEPKLSEQQGSTTNGKTIKWRRVEKGSDKDFQWRRKLAGMLIELDPDTAKHEGKLYLLRDFPEGYVLWQQLTYDEGEENEATAVTKAGKKSHAAGGANRDDAYLFGHPLGKAKKYRSPVEYFPHFLWLMTDMEGNRDNCSCKFCSPDQAEYEERDRLLRAEAELGFDGTSDVKGKDQETAKSSLQAKGPATAESTKNVIQPSSSTVPAQQSATVSVPARQNPPAQSQSNASRPAVATQKSTESVVLKTPPTAEQEFDSRANSPFIYRPGELVWWDKEKRWGLAVICKRQLQYGKAEYLLQPLSNPNQPKSQQTRGHDKMRPYLAWSAPPPTFIQLQGLTFDQVPWERVVRGEFQNPHPNKQPGDAEVDGSILAAAMIDSSYSLFDKIPFPESGLTSWKGMFLGSEKVWVGEPVRLHTQADIRARETEIYVLIIEALIEKPGSYLMLVGDIYVDSVRQSSYTHPSEWPSQPELPARMQADLDYRNQVAHNANARTFHYWQLVEPRARRRLERIRGKWYEAQPLLHTLRGEAQANVDIATGKIVDMSNCMNPRMPAGNATVMRKKNRADAMGASVPRDVKISRGLDGPAEEAGFVSQAAPNQNQRGNLMMGGMDGDVVDVDNYIDLEAEHGGWGQGGGV